MPTSAQAATPSQPGKKFWLPKNQPAHTSMTCSLGYRKMSNFFFGKLRSRAKSCNKVQYVSIDAETEITLFKRELSRAR
jgi:hypothetical protein